MSSAVVQLPCPMPMSDTPEDPVELGISTELECSNNPLINLRLKMKLSFTEFERTYNVDVFDEFG